MTASLTLLIVVIGYSALVGCGVMPLIDALGVTLGLWRDET